MFTLFKKNQTGEKLELQIAGMHCSSCSLNIDAELEDMKGVLNADTSYASGKSTVFYDSTIITPQQIMDAIHTLGYTATKT